MIQTTPTITDKELGLVYRQDGSITTYPPDGILNGENVLPGFTLPLIILL